MTCTTVCRKLRAAEIARDPQILYTLGWQQFENLIAGILEKSGWSIEPLARTKDGGVDIVAARLVDPGIPFQMMVQCKRHAASNKVEVSQVREVWAVKSLQGFHQAMIATTSSFTKGAKLQADYWNLDLRDHDAVVQWCKDMGGVPL